MNEFNINNIVQIEFMKEWTMNLENNCISKEIIAYVPIFKRYTMEKDEYRGLVRMYWVLCQ